MSAPPATGRLHAFDGLRAAMMLLGVVLHVGLSYTVAPMREVWPVEDAATSILFDLSAIAIHLFRMPTFFVMAGFFGAMLIERRGERAFVRNRLLRVGVPLVVAWLVILRGLPWLARWSLPDGAIVDALRDEAPVGSVRSIHVLGHLWFLYDLLLFYAGALLVLALARRLPSRVTALGSRAGDRLVLGRWSLVLLVLITALTLWPMAAVSIDTDASLAPAPRVLAAYGVFFWYGWLVFGRQGRIAQLTSGTGGRLIGAAASALVFVVLLTPLHERGAGPVRATAAIAAAVAIWLAVWAWMGVFTRYFSVPRPWMRYLADASYWIYLVHVPVAVVLGLALAPAPLNAFVKFGIAFALTTSISLFTYHLAVRRTIIGRVLNGPRGQR